MWRERENGRGENPVEHLVGINSRRFVVKWRLKRQSVKEGDSNWAGTLCEWIVEEK